MEKLTVAQITEKLKTIKGWSHEDGFLVNSYKFSNFKEAFATMTRIAFECEAMGHHPNWENVYNSLTIRLNTHDANGITDKDFKLAAAIDKIVN